MERILEITNPMLLSVGIIFIVCGLIMYLFPPKKINSLYGYRTAASMKSQAKWDFAQKYSAKIMCLVGLVLIASSFYISSRRIRNDQHAMLGSAILIGSAVSLIVIVEKA